MNKPPSAVVRLESSGPVADSRYLAMFDFAYEDLPPACLEAPSQKGRQRDEPNHIWLALVANRTRSLAYLRGRLGSLEDAEDVLHDAYVRLLRASDQLRDPTRIDAWLSQTLRNAVIDRYRRNGARKRLRDEYAMHVHEADDGTAIDDQLDRVDQLITTLKPAYADVIRRADLKGQSHAEIARDLSLSVGNMAVRLHRARAALRELIEASDAISRPSPLRTPLHLSHRLRIARLGKYNGGAAGAS
jgi:RNA polymerase sigma-70 factor, ECF subfamily